jgi:hypothetical protein
MMLPAFMLVGIGQEKPVWIPLPFFLLWPFWLLGWVVWLFLKAARAPQGKALKKALMLGASLSGLVVEVDSKKDDTHIHLRLI